MASNRQVKEDRRRSAKEHSPYPAYILALLVVFLFTTSVFVTVMRKYFVPQVEESRTLKITHDALGPVYTSEGDIIKVYVFTDPDTDIQYLVSDRGGLTPRLWNDE